MEIASLITSVKAAYDIAKGINSLKAEVDRNQSISNLLEILLSVQSDAFTMQVKQQELLQENDNLRKKIIEFEKWSETEKQYELKEIYSGVFVYAYKKPDDSEDPMHWLCTKCYKEKKASIIQLSNEVASGKYYICPTCKTEIHIPSRRYSGSS